MPFVNLLNKEESGQSGILLANSREFLESGNDSLKKKRYNAATDSFFKAIVTLCDYALFIRLHMLPKDHTERFDLLKIHYPEAFRTVSSLFRVYRRTYNVKSGEEDATAALESYYGLARYFGIEKEVQKGL